MAFDPKPNIYYQIYDKIDKSPYSYNYWNYRTEELAREFISREKERGNPVEYGVERITLTAEDLG